MTQLGTGRLLQDGTRPHAFLGAAMWTLAVVATLASGALAAMMALMPMSLDWGETIVAGTDPWLAALVAAAQFVGVAAASTLGIVLWHTRRYKPAALVLVAVALLTTLWLGARFVGEYT